MKLRTALLALTITGLAACATPTPYQSAADGSYGYAERQIEQDRFLVTFAGNSLTDLETVELALLLRAAELTIERGYDHFTIVRRETESETETYAAFPSRYDVRHRYYHPYYGWYGWRDPFWDDANRREITRYEAQAEIILGRGETPDDPDAYDARQVITNIGPQVPRPEPGA